MLHLPVNIGELVAEGSLIISVETEGNWSFIALENMFQLHKERLNNSAAEDYCVGQGGHLASVGSEREEEQIIKVADGNNVWLGGRRSTRGLRKR